MICYAKKFLRHARRGARIRVGRPRSMILITGSSKERINATFDRFNRVDQLIVHTRSTRVR